MLKYFLASIFLLLFTSGFTQQNPQLEKVDVKSYQFDISIDDDSDQIFGESFISILIKEETDTIFLELDKKEGKKGMEIHGLWIGDKIGSFDHSDDKIVIHNKEKWRTDSIYRIRIEYSGIPADGLIISNNKFGKRTFFGDNWPNRAHFYLPVIDHPSDKAFVNFSITCPEHYEVIASGSPKGIWEIKNGKKKHSFESALPFSTKIMVFAAADFKVTAYDTINNIPVSSWIFADNQRGIGDYRVSEEALKYFSDEIGPYIYEKLANVQSKTRYGGMENAGNIFYFENSVTGNSDMEALVVHEVAHHWFGNAATEMDWHHLWLSEGFATYLTSMFFEEKYGVEHFRKRLKRDRERILKFNSVRSMSVIDTTITDWIELLNVLNYDKGSWILHMLRHKTGDRQFRAILSAYYDRYKYSNALSKDFQEVAEDISGLDLDRFFEQWLYYPTNPELKIKYFDKKGKRQIRIEQVQKGKTFEFNLEILMGDKLIHFPINKRSHDFTIDNIEEGMPVKIDPGCKLLHKSSIRKQAFTEKDIQLLKEETALIESTDGYLLKEGDILFQDLDCGPLCDAIESVTFGINGANFSHVAMISEIRNDSVIIIEAIGGKVKETYLEDFLNRSFDERKRPKVMVGRTKDKRIGQSAVKEISNYLGKKYDVVFDIEDDSYYCSELLYFSYKGKNDKPVFKLYPMTFKNPNNGEYDPAWIDYYEKLGVAIPEGKPGLNPGGISISPFVKVLYRFGAPDGYKHE